MVTGPVDIDEIYRRMPLGRIPWNSETPPDALVELVRTGRVRPSRTIDLGCGAGNYAIWLAGQGFDVTGVDSSPTAIGIAREKAEKAGASCRFVVADLLGDLHEIDGKFDFGYDWELLHHI
ncbi:MAG: class I SAM-dependent methyltransferase, partial [Methanomicrobiales archaeon]|nr:class I SAM-dependent methyltransferase [Methanomicrobiales archaeon]